MSIDENTLIQYAVGKKDTSFIIPNSVKVIGLWAFASSENLLEATIPNSVIIIEYGALVNGYNLNKIIIPNSVTSLSEYVLSECHNLTIYYQFNLTPSGWSSEWNPSDRPVVWENVGN